MKYRKEHCSQKVSEQELKYDPGAVTKNISPPLLCANFMLKYLFYAKSKATSPGCNKIQFTWNNERLIFKMRSGQQPYKAKDTALLKSGRTCNHKKLNKDIQNQFEKNLKSLHLWDGRIKSQFKECSCSYF